MKKKEHDEVDDFLEAQRVRGVKRTIFALLLLAGGYYAWRTMPHDVSRLLSLSPKQQVDAAASLFPLANVSPERKAELDRYRQLLSRTFPAWVDELRRFRKSKATGGEADAAALASSRDALLKAVAKDDQLRAPLSILVATAEKQLTAGSTEIAQVFSGLNTVLQQRKLPFQLAATIVQQDSIPTLRIRFHELVAEDTYQVGETAQRVQFLERLDLTNLDRDPDRQPAGTAVPTVYLRAVATDANAGLFGALHPAGTWQLTRTVALSPEMQALETSLAQRVAQEWTPALGLLPSTVREGMTRVSQAVTRRNDLYRQINLRDVGKQVMFEPSSLALGWGGDAWLERMEPYAVQGRIRLTLEDIEKIKSWDRELEALLDTAAPAIRTLLKSEARSAAVAEVRRVMLQAQPLPAVEALTLRLGEEEAKAAVPWLGARWTQVVESGDQCFTRMASLATAALESDPVNQATAQVALEKLASDTLSGRPLASGTLKEALDSLAKLSCKELAEKATVEYQAVFGPYTSIVDATDTVADVSDGSVSERMH